jgi:hypothetical protein
MLKAGIRLMPNAKKEVTNWKNYQNAATILNSFYAISNAEALSVAKELSGLVNKLKDSIPDEKLRSAAVLTRINILNNECLRLNDMASISSISPQEVAESVKKIAEAYSGFNAKLNSVYAVSALENELELDPDFMNILNDTTNNSLWDVKNKIEIQNKKNDKKINERKRNLLKNRKTNPKVQEIEKTVTPIKK